MNSKLWNVWLKMGIQLSHCPIRSASSALQCRTQPECANGGVLLTVKLEHINGGLEYFPNTVYSNWGEVLSERVQYYTVDFIFLGFVVVLGGFQIIQGINFSGLLSKISQLFPCSLLSFPVQVFFRAHFPIYSELN